MSDKTRIHLNNLIDKNELALERIAENTKQLQHFLLFVIGFGLVSLILLVYLFTSSFGRPDSVANARSSASLLASGARVRAASKR